MTGDAILERYCLYLYGVVQRLMGLHALAVKTIEAAIKLEPFLWAAWMELSLIAKAKSEVFGLDVPYSWMTLMFLGTTLTVVDPSLPLVQQIWSKLDSVFPDCPYVMSQRAVAYNAKYPQEVSCPRSRSAPPSRHIFFLWSACLIFYGLHQPVANF